MSCISKTKRGGHNFDAPAFFGAVALRSDTTSGEILANGGKVELTGGKAIDIYFVPEWLARIR